MVSRHFWTINSRIWWYGPKGVPRLELYDRTNPLWKNLPYGIWSCTSFVDLCHNIKGLHLVGVIPSRTITPLKIDKEPKNHPIFQKEHHLNDPPPWLWRLQHNFPECTPKKNYSIIFVNLHFLGDPNHPFLFINSIFVKVFDDFSVHGIYSATWDVRQDPFLDWWASKVPKKPMDGGAAEEITSHYTCGGFLKWWVFPTTMVFSY